MSEDSKRHRITFARKGLRGQAFASHTAMVDDPTDPEERKQVIAEIKSSGMTEICEALSDRLDEEIEQQIARIRGERQERKGSSPVKAPSRRKTHDSFKPSTVEQREDILTILEKEDEAGGHPAKRGYVNAILKREGSRALDLVSYDGAEKILQHIDDARAVEIEPEDFATHQQRPLTEQQQYAADVAEYGDADHEQPPPPPVDEAAERDEADAAELDYSRAVVAMKALEDGDDATHAQMVADMDARSDALRDEDMETRLAVAKAEADEMDGIEESEA